MKLNRYQKAWLTALRSGEYEQATGLLCETDDDSMCCLGVLCDVIDPDRWSVIQSTVYDQAVAVAWDEDSDYLPPTWATDLVGLSFDAVGHLSTLNDIDYWTFEQIADWLEQRWAGQVGV